MDASDYRELVRWVMGLLGSEDWRSLPVPQRGRLTGRCERFLTLMWNRSHPKARPQKETHMETLEATDGR